MVDESNTARVLLVHLSDIHFRSGQANVGTDRADAIADAIGGMWSAATAVCIVLTGDIAFAGKPLEYEMAYDFLAHLRAALEKRFKLTTAAISAAPGNHDCDFSLDTQARRILVSVLPSSNASVDDSVAATCVAVQQPFFEFLERLEGRARVAPSLEALCYTRRASVGAFTIEFICLNTAWISQISERQGTLMFPTTVIRARDEAADVAVALFHHPYNWLESQNARAFRSMVERSADLVLTGHEHEADSYEKTRPDQSLLYLEGAVLQGSGPSQSGFNVLVLTLGPMTFTLHEFGWGGRAYLPIRTTGSRALNRNKALRPGEFELTPSFQATLSDPGAAFTHPSKRVITLDDLFIYPDLDERKAGKKPEDSPLVVSERVLPVLKELRRVHLLGAERAGKTSLAKQLFKEQLAQQRVPILVDGGTFRPESPAALVEQVSKAVREQYGAGTVDAYRVLPVERRSLIIDDFDQSPSGHVARGRLLDLIEDHFESITILTDTLFQVEEITGGGKETSRLLTYRSFAIKPFGHRLREKLITKWLTVGVDEESSQAELADRIRQAEAVINTLLGKNLLPSFPLFILAMLQSMEANSSINTPLGSYGHIYDALVMRAMAFQRRDMAPDAKFSYVAWLAYGMFSRQRQTLTKDELDDLTQAYKAEYQLRFDTDGVIRDLERALVLQTTGGAVRFRYRYVYDYFVAKYMHDHWSDDSERETLRSQVQILIDHLHHEDSANTLLFFVYFTRSPQVIEAVVAKARSIYTDATACDLETDVGFLNALPEATKPVLSLPAGTEAEHREDVRRELDEVDGSQEGPTEGGEQSQENKQLEVLVRVNTAFKTLQLIGQILRNFTGSLRANVKEAIAEESYLLGLRTLNAMLGMIQENLEGMREVLEEYFERDRGIKDELRRKEMADRTLYGFSFFIAYSAIRRVSFAVGSTHLRDTYKAILDRKDSTAFSLVDAAIKLDHYKDVPLDDIIELYRELDSSGNVFSATLLRTLVRNHLYVFPMEVSARQRLASKLEISTPDALLIARGGTATTTGRRKRHGKRKRPQQKGARR